MNKLILALRENENFIIASHLGPDGDAIGSSVALALILKHFGKNVLLYNASGLPADFEWIGLPSPLLASLENLPDLSNYVCVFVDCGDSSRAGAEIKNLVDTNSFKLTLCIDHHTGNPNFATHNWVDSAMSATALMVGLIAKELGVPMQGALGEAVYFGLVSDTGFFSYANTDSRTLNMAAEIIDLGLNVGELNSKIENTWSFARLQFWGRLFNKTVLCYNSTIAYTLVSLAELADAGLDSSSLSDFGSWLRRLKGVCATVIIRETGEGVSKASFRSAPNVNVQEVAHALGGGGHKNAAAVEVKANLNETLKKIMPLLEAAVSKSCKK